ncbi:MAG: aspartate--tRNA ligase [Myxococcota bacterium]|jgi:aspartyl-tRNA synthetase|nr:aspartate--tRNA ligase [Myxococcota bacterium]
MQRESTHLDPMGSLRRTHLCGDIGNDQVGQEVVLAGWANRRRDHGGVIFVDLRDRTGIVQVVFKPEVQPAAHERAGLLRNEFVLMVRGVLENRSDDTINEKMKSGRVEVNVHELRLLNTATPPPFVIEEETDAEEATRLRHRIHDLRRPPLQRAIAVRHKLAQAVRSALDEQGFLEIETPILARSSPEGARDFLVPARQHPGSFYALPQSPQIMKQLLMIAGCERYYQIARCFRDEEQRADRQLEFTQVDLEMSFVGVEDVLAVLEEVTARGCKEAGDVEFPRPFKRITYKEAMDRYGSDKPDTRILLELADLTEDFRTSEFKAFRGVVESGGIVKCLHVPDAQQLSRGDLDRLESLVRKELGAKGLAWIRIGDESRWQGPIVKFLGDAEKQAIESATGLAPGSLVFFQADEPQRANAILSRLRIDLGVRLGRTDGREWDALLVVDFPLFERDADGNLTYVHQPFVAPLEEDIPLLDSEPEAVRGTHYDVVLNGTELGSGSLRNHRADVQLKILELMGYSEERAQHNFGFLLEALETGAPPHGGFAFGFDRWVMVMAKAPSLRDVIPFPKTQRGQDLVMQAPSEVANDQLEDLSIRVRKPRPTAGG